LSEAAATTWARIAGLAIIPTADKTAATIATLDTVRFRESD
jgi:hypothetical protein